MDPGFTKECSAHAAFVPQLRQTGLMHTHDYLIHTSLSVHCVNFPSGWVSDVKQSLIILNNPPPSVISGMAILSAGHLKARYFSYAT